MSKLIPVPDEQSQPFWDAINERRLVVQSCTDCGILQTAASFSTPRGLPARTVAQGALGGRRLKGRATYCPSLWCTTADTRSAYRTSPITWLS